MPATIQGIYIALFGRPADPAGLAYFNAETKNGADLTAIGDLAGTAEYQSRFTSLSSEQIVNSIYRSLFERDAEPAGLKLFVDGLKNGTYTINNIAIAILDGAQGADLTTVNAKIAAANLFTSHLDLSAEITAYRGEFAASVGRDYINAVDASDAATEAEADAAILRLFPDQGQGPDGGNSGGGGFSGSNGNPNLAPIANDDTLAATEDTTVTYTAAQLVGNDTDANGDTLTITAVGNAVKGTVVLNADGSVNFTPDADYSGAASFKYTISDGRGLSDTAIANINVASVNDAPTTSPVTLQAIAEDSGPRIITTAELVSNVLDIDSDTFTVSNLQLTAGSKGALADNGNGTWTFTPALNDDSAVGFTYTISDNGTPTETVGGSATLDLTPVNDRPVINIDSVRTYVAENSAATVVATGSISDDSASTSITLSGDNAKLFSISGNALVLNANIDYEALPVGDKILNVTLTVTDTEGLSATRDFAVEITNVAETIVLAPTGDTVRLPTWHINDLIQIDRAGAPEVGGFEYAEAAGTFGNLAEALFALTALTTGPSKDQNLNTWFGPVKLFDYLSGDNDVVAAQYTNASGGTNVVVGIDNEHGWSDGYSPDLASYLNDRLIIIENIDLTAISKANFELL